MKYHLNRDGQNLGVFSLEELQRRRAAGDLTGEEKVWTEGMPAWQTLNSVIPPPPAAAPSRITPPPPANKSSVAVIVAVVAGLLILGVGVVGVFGYWLVTRPAFHRLHQIFNETGNAGASAMEAATKPVTINSNTLTAAAVMKDAREFRVREYLEGYRERGERNPECDAAALGMISNWIACNYGGEVDTNLPSLTELSDRLANDPACTDPLVLTVAGVNAAELHEAVRRLERAARGFEHSQHRGYPKFYATETLASKLIYDQSDRWPVLDAQAVQYLQAALTDGSIRPEDQPELGEVLVRGWGKAFFGRNAVAVLSAVQAQGEKFRWLALVLEGEHEIDEAWSARGGGYANTVSDAGWKGFSQHLVSARKCLTRAWELKPNLPLAPCRMMTVSLGSAGIDEMRLWFDRTTAAQFDYADAWSELRWGLRPRWFGDTDAMLAFGVTALNTRRFDTDVPYQFYDSIKDLEAESNLSQGEHLFDRDDIWPHLKEMYEGYINETSLDTQKRDGWRSMYAVVAYLAGKYDVAREQLLPMNWQPHAWNLTGWGRDLSIMALEVGARTGAQSKLVAQAEAKREAGEFADALKIYGSMAETGGLDAQTRNFVRERQFSLDMEQRLQAGEWVRFLPDAQFTGWQTNFGGFKVLPAGALEVTSDQYGHLCYCRARVGTEFEVRGQFDVVSSTSKAFQAGLVMGVPQDETYNWYAFRIKRNSDEGDVASFSQHRIKRQVLSPLSKLDGHSNAFDFRFQHGRASATVNGQEVFKEVEPPKNTYVTTNEFLVGLGAFNDSNATVLRYHDLEIRNLKDK